MSENLSVNEKITKISELLGIVCEELKVDIVFRTMAVAYMQTKREACIRAYDRAVKALGVK